MQNSTNNLQTTLQYLTESAHVTVTSVKCYGLLTGPHVKAGEMNQGICSMFMQQILTSHDLLWIPYNYGDHSFESTEPWLIQHRGPTLLNGHAKFGVSTIHYTRVRLNLLQKSEVSEQDSNLFQPGWERGREVERERKREREKERNLLFGREREKQIVIDIFWKLEESKKEDSFQSLGNF